MSALHEALKSLGPIDFSDVPLDDLKPFLSDAFRHGQLIVESVPVPALSSDLHSHSNTNTSSSASSVSDIFPSPAHSPPPSSDVEALQKEWKSVKLNSKDNPLGISVYKLPSKDGKGAWFARRSAHEGLGFTRWKKALEHEFPETMKVRGGPGEGNIRGIGGEKRVECKNVKGVGKLEVYLLSAQFAGPTTPRDFVTMLLTSDHALTDESGGENEVPRHYMVISKPCNHPDTAPRDGYIRGEYESVEFIREIPRKKPPQRSASAMNLSSQGKHARNQSSTLGKEAVLRNATRNHSRGMSDSDVPIGAKASASETDLSHSESRARGKTISFDSSRDTKGEKLDNSGQEDESESNPVEWIMITRSDPGGSVPRFMVERGTPGGIVSDAGKFLNWASSKNIEDFDSDEEASVEDEQEEKAQKTEHPRPRDHERDLHKQQTNGHLVGVENKSTTAAAPESPESAPSNGSGLYEMVAGAADAITSHAPAIIADRFSGYANEESKESYNGNTDNTPNVEKKIDNQDSPRRDSISTISSESSWHSFASARESIEEEEHTDTSPTQTPESEAEFRAALHRDKQLQKLEEKKRKLDEKLNKAREKEASKKNEDSAHEAIRKAEEKHRKEVDKLEKKKQKEIRKAETRRRKAIEKDERAKLLRELESVKAEVAMLRKEKEILNAQVGVLQAENTNLAARIGKMGTQGEEVLKEAGQEVKQELKNGS